MTGDRAAARELLIDGVRVATLHDIPGPRTICLAQLALLDIQDGRWDHAHELMHRARNFQHRDGLRDYATQAGVFAVSALVDVQRGDRGAAQRRRAHRRAAAGDPARVHPLARRAVALGAGRRAAAAR